MSMASLAVSSAGRGVTVARGGSRRDRRQGFRGRVRVLPRQGVAQDDHERPRSRVRAARRITRISRRVARTRRDASGADRSRARTARARARRAPARATRRSPASRRSLLRRARLLRGKSDDATEPASEPGRRRSFRSRILSSPARTLLPPPHSPPVSARSLTSSPSFPPSISQVSRCPARSSPAREAPAAAARWWWWRGALHRVHLHGTRRARARTSGFRARLATPGGRRTLKARCRRAQAPRAGGRRERVEPREEEEPQVMRRRECARARDSGWVAESGGGRETRAWGARDSFGVEDEGGTVDGFLARRYDDALNAARGTCAMMS